MHETKHYFEYLIRDGKLYQCLGDDNDLGDTAGCADADL